MLSGTSMPTENDFLPFAVGGSANVTSQTAYAANTTLTQDGFQSGIANSADLNKVWRQSSIMSAVLARFIVQQSGQPAIDDGTTATLEANLVAAIRSATKTGVILADAGAANAYTAVNAPPLAAGTWVDGVVQQVKIAHANTGASTYAPDGLTAIPIYGLGLQPLQGGELALNGTAILMHATIAGVNSGNPICVLMECAGGAQQVPPATQTNHAVNLGQFASSLVSSGYQKLPSGLILQWGSTSITTQSVQTITLPIAYPNAFLMAAGNTGTVITTNAPSITLGMQGNGTKTGFSVLAGSATSGTTGITWFSLGF